MKFSSLSALKVVKMLAKLMENVVNTQLGLVLPLRHDTVACLLMPQSHPTTGPVQFLAPVRFLFRKAEWSARQNFTPVLFSWSHQATACQGCTVMAWSNNSQDSTWTPCGARMGVVRAPHGNVICYGTRQGPVRDPQGCHTAPLPTHKVIDTTKICKIPTRASYLAVHLRSPQGLFTGYLRPLNPHGARKLIMYALKLHGPHTGRQNLYDTARTGPVSGRAIFVQNSPGTARTGPGSVMWQGCMFESCAAVG